MSLPEGDPLYEMKLRGGLSLLVYPSTKKREHAPDGFVFISAAPSATPDKPESRKYHRVDHITPGFGRSPWLRREVTEEEARSLGFSCCGMKSCLGPAELRELEDYEARKRADREAAWQQRREAEITAAQRGRLEADAHRLVAVEAMRWVCSCGAHGRKCWPSEEAAALEWIRHILRLAEVVQPRYYEDWMHHRVADVSGLRLADLQRSLGLGIAPILGAYPWSMIEPEDS